jgi:hypothetical protein
MTAMATTSMFAPAPNVDGLMRKTATESTAPPSPATAPETANACNRTSEAGTPNARAA